VSKKFFSLIHGDQIHIAPNTKVIPAESFSTLIDAQEALNEVRKDAEQYKKEVVSDIEKLKSQAQKEGFEQGFSEWVQKIAELETEISKVRRDVQKVIVPIALKAAKKIVGREIEISNQTVIDIITNSLKVVSQHKKIRIYVNPKEFDAVEESRNRIKTIFENLEVLSIQPKDDVDPGGCVIETEAGIINAQLENQWMILENAFQRLINAEQPLTQPSSQTSTSTPQKNKVEAGKKETE
jgi:type III secretion protein L